MTTIRCEPRRHSRSLSQSFHITKTKVRHLVVLLGSSGNAHVVTIKKNSIHCNCPDCVSSCKHILFLAIACGFLNRRSTTATFSFASLLQRLHSPSPAPLLEAATSDPHTAKLCSVHDCSPCIHCARSPNSHPAATFIICSSCGFLAHQQCFDTFQDNFACDTAPNSRRPTCPCPQCNKLSHLLPSPIVSGCRNFSAILSHRGHRCHRPNSTADDGSFEESFETRGIPTTDLSNRTDEEEFFETHDIPTTDLSNGTHLHPPIDL